MKRKLRIFFATFLLLCLFMSPAYMAEKKHPEYDAVKKTIEGSISWAIEMVLSQDPDTAHVLSGLTATLLT